jgi:hypothetical protein
MLINGCEEHTNARPVIVTLGTDLVYIRDIMHIRDIRVVRDVSALWHIRK